MSTQDVTSSIRTRAALRVLAVLLRATMFLVALAVFVPPVLFMNGSVSAPDIDATLDAPLVITQGANRWQSKGKGIEANIGNPDAIRGFFPNEVRGQVYLDSDDDSATAIYVAGITLVGVLAVIGLAMLGEVVGSARSGEPFARSNVRRLRTAAICAIGIPIIVEATERGLVHIVDVGDAVKLDPALLPPWPFVLLAAGALGFAEIFRRGADLNDFDQLAI